MIGLEASGTNAATREGERGTNLKGGGGGQNSNNEKIPKLRAGEPEPGVFGSLEPEPLEKKTRSRSRLEKKSQEPEPVKISPARR